MEMGKLVKFEADISFEDETFEEVLADLGRKVPSASVRIVKLVGSGGGWPTVEVTIPQDRIKEFADWYCGGEDDGEMEEVFTSGVVPI